MTIRLPTLDELSREQEEILDLRLTGNYLVTGPPGTGKTVMAIYRAGLLHAKGEATRFLMYNQLLSRYTQLAMKGKGLESVVSTYNSWFTKFYKDVCGGSPPTIGDPYTFDWDACLSDLIKAGIPPSERRHILVDEGQDMQRQFYALASSIGQTVTVFADENQTITDHNSKLEEIARILRVDEIRHLTMNYRNTARIAKVAEHFHAGIQTGVSAVPSDRKKGELPALIHHDKLHHTVEFIANWEKLHGDQSIGVLVPYRSQQIQLCNRLKGKTRHPIGTYIAGGSTQPEIDFDKPGVKIVNFMSSKGLEFDTVFLPELQSWNTATDSLDFRRKMFVMTSRAREMLFFIYSGDGEPAIVNGLPLHLLDDRRK